MDLLELFGLIGQFSLHFLGSDEEILQERPGFLDFDHHLHNVVNSAEVLFPGLDYFLEVADVLGKQHVVDQQLVFFQSFEVFVNQFERVDVGVFVLHQLELDFRPFLRHNGDLLGHLEFLLGSIGDVFDLVFVVEEFEVPDLLDVKALIDGELGVHEILDLVPVSAVFDDHGGVFEFV